MKLEEVMQKLQYLTIAEVENPKLEVEHLQKISPTLNLDNWMTYVIFLQYRQDLPEAEREMYLQLIEALKQNERELYEKELKRFEIKI